MYLDYDMPPNSLIDEAIISLDFHVQNPIAAMQLPFSQIVTKDLTGCFTPSSNDPVIYTIQSIGNPNLVSATISGNNLLITASSNLVGKTKVKIKAVSGTKYGYHNFDVRVFDPNQIFVMTEDFQTFPPTNWLNDGWEQALQGVSDRCIKTNYLPAGTSVITSKEIALAPDQAATLSFYWKNNDVFKVIGHDSTFCEITDDNGTTWDELVVLSAPNYQDAFSKVTKSLDPYKGKTAKLRWRYKTDGSEDAFGAALDEVEVYYSNVGIADSYKSDFLQLDQNYPNPFNPVTTITFNLQKDADVKLAVYNQAGAEVAVVTENHMNQGEHSYNFDGSKLTSGVYYYNLKVNNQQKSGKMLLIK